MPAAIRLPRSAYKCWANNNFLYPLYLPIVQLFTKNKLAVRAHLVHKKGPAQCGAFFMDQVDGYWLSSSQAGQWSECTASGQRPAPARRDNKAGASTTCSWSRSYYPT